VCSSRAQAELVAALAELSFRGTLRLPEDEDHCRDAMAELESRLNTAQGEFETITSERVAAEKKRAGIVARMIRWRIHGKRNIDSHGNEPKDESCRAPEIT